MKHLVITRNASDIARRIGKREFEIGFVKKGDGTLAHRHATINPAVIAKFSAGTGERNSNPATHFLFADLTANGMRQALIENIVYIQTASRVYLFDNSRELCE